MTKEKNSQMQTAAPDPKADQKQAGASSKADAADEGTLAQLQNDVERFKDLALRAAADLDNFRKRSTREKQEAIQYANARLLEALIPALDHFELGLSAARTA